MSTSFLILGGGHAAAQLAASLRQDGWAGDISLLGEETYPPYNRPPLSKDYLAGTRSEEELLIRSAAHYNKAGIRCLTGQRAVSIECTERKVLLASGKTLAYDKLALTTGARVRQLDVPGAGLDGVFYLRSIADVQKIRQALRPGGRAVIIGGGFIGLETAAVLRRSAAMQVTVLEAADRLLNRVSAPAVSTFYRRVHEEEGVRIITGSGISHLEGDRDGRVTAVCCRNGEQHAADLVIVGIGVVPNTALAEAAGLAVDDGVLVDKYCCSSDPNVYAAGDCTRFISPFYQRPLRLESVQNAVDQAQTAAANACGLVREYTALPWFWSDQYEIKLQIAGVSNLYDELVIRGDIASGRKFAAFYFREGHLIAVDAVNYPQAFMLGKLAIIDAKPVDMGKLEDTNIPLREVLQR